MIVFCLKNMSKRSYRGDSFTENGNDIVKSNGNSNGSSRRVLKKSELDEIASGEGFHFVHKLRLGNSLYTNEDKTRNIVYDKYGHVVSDYIPKSCLQGSVEFHNPIACLPAVLSNSGFRQYTGKNGFMKKG